MANIDFTHGGNIYQIKEKIIDFSANINPLGLTKAAKQAVLKNIDDILHYPDSWAEGLTKKIASYWKIKEENILLGNGSCELIYLIARFSKPQTALIPIPTFSEYERALRAVKSKVKFLKLKENFVLDLNKAEKADTAFICNPNNPTGNLLIKNRELNPVRGRMQTASTISNGVKSFPAKLTVIDETFMDFLPDEKKHTFIQQACKNKNIMVLRTFTKFFALPGLRVGYLTTHKDLVKKLKKTCAPWSINIFAQELAKVMINDKKYIENTHKLVKKEQSFLISEIGKIRGLSIYPSAANFFLIKIEKPKITSLLLRKKLIRKGILIRDCSNFRNLNDKFIRIAVRGHSQNQRLITAFKEVLYADS
ncbi:MAG: threonine-phosphate decarboxylase CobD [Candidatus Omnitrophota bacterium]